MILVPKIFQGLLLEDKEQEKQGIAEKKNQKKTKNKQECGLKWRLALVLSCKGYSEDQITGQIKVHLEAMVGTKFQTPF